jgi:hypothetical protein
MANEFVDGAGHYDHLSLDDLRQLRHQLTEQETRVSYWRRILQARIDLLVAAPENGGMAGLSAVLTDAPSAHRRLAHLTVEPVDDEVPLPDLPALWARVADPKDPSSQEALIADLREAEAQVSALRSQLFVSIDDVTGELIRRFHDNPSLALMALPRR